MPVSIIITDVALDSHHRWKPNFILSTKMLFPSFLYLSDPECFILFYFRVYVAFIFSSSPVKTLTWFLFPLYLQVMESLPSQASNQSSYKQVFIHAPRPSLQDIFIGEALDLEVNLSTNYPT